MTSPTGPDYPDPLGILFMVVLLPLMLAFVFFIVGSYQSVGQWLVGLLP